MAEPGFQEAPPPGVTQTGGDDQGNEVSHQPAALSGKELSAAFRVRFTSRQVVRKQLICLPASTPTDVESRSATVDSGDPLPAAAPPLSVRRPAVQPRAPSTLQALL